jgi:hypothetical protein
MRIQFSDKREAARFAAAVVNVTGRMPVLTRTERSTWRVQAAELNREWAFAISSLLQSGVPSQQVTLDEVASRVESVQWTAGCAAAEAEPQMSPLERLLAAARSAASLGLRPKVFAAAAG